MGMAGRGYPMNIYLIISLAFLFVSVITAYIGDAINQLRKDVFAGWEYTKISMITCGGFIIFLVVWIMSTI
jgi:hypothetical protein